MANPLVEKSVEHRRMKGVSRQTQALLPERLFGQDPRENTAVVHSVALRPTAGFEMALVAESKTITHGLNFKRRAVVRNDARTPTAPPAAGTAKKTRSFSSLSGLRPHCQLLRRGKKRHG